MRLLQVCANRETVPLPRDGQEGECPRAPEWYNILIFSSLQGYNLRLLWGIRQYEGPDFGTQAAVSTASPQKIGSRF